MAIKLNIVDYRFSDDSAELENRNLLKLIRKRFEIALSDDPDFLLYSDFRYRYLRYDCTRKYVTGENRRPNFNECDFGFSFDYPVSDRNYRLPIYKFSIAFENDSYPGYTTEKLVEAMQARTIPFFWGDPLVQRDFNTKAFVNCHDYDTFEDVVRRVREIDTNPDLYLSMLLKEPCFAGDQIPESIRDENILDRLEEIFARPPAIPVARTWKSRWAKRKYSLAGLKSLKRKIAPSNHYVHQATAVASELVHDETK